jgi:hypothetical protein
MPFLDHLEELRWRIIYSLGALVIGLAIGLYFAFAYNIIDWLQAPIMPYMDGRRLGILHPMDGFTIRLQIAFGIAAVLAAPVIGFQVWSFLAPALHKPEKKIVLPVLFAAAILFLVGAALAWFFVLQLVRAELRRHRVLLDGHQHGARVRSGLRGAVAARHARRARYPQRGPDESIAQVRRPDHLPGRRHTVSRRCDHGDIVAGDSAVFPL